MDKSISAGLDLFVRSASLLVCFYGFFLSSLVNARKHLHVPQGGDDGVQAFTFCYLVSCGLASNPLLMVSAPRFEFNNLKDYWQLK